MGRFAVLIGLVMAFAIAMPGSTQATNLSEVQTLLASDPQEWDHFGTSVSMSGDFAVVGSVPDDVFGTGIGAAYVYQRDGGSGRWNEVKKLVAFEGENFDFDWFGRSVAITGDTVFVGAPFDHVLGGAGAVYVFERDQGGPGNWGEVKKLGACGVAGVHFGAAGD